jgi:hypothetical protein
MMEAGVVIDDQREPIYWHVPPGRTGGSLPDSRDLWSVLWENRATLLGFAHSHPGHGVPGPSSTDVSTFVAVEKALGRPLLWWIVSEDHVVVCRNEDNWAPRLMNQTQVWLPELRRLSYGGEQWTTTT